MPDPLGFEHPGEFDFLAAHADTVDGPFMEIGTYAGRSAVKLGGVARAKDTVLFCVDHHRGSPEMAPGQDCHDPAMIGDDGRHDSLPHLRRNLADRDLEQWVTPIVSDSRNVAGWWNLELGLLFIDGGHEHHIVVDDYKRFSRWVRPDGLLCFHDSEDAGGPAAVLDLAVEDGWVEIDRHHSLTVFAR